MKSKLIINLKTYHNGKKLLSLVKKIESVNKQIIVAAQPTDIYFLKKNTNLAILAQHVDYCEPGRNTGYITPESVKEQGAKGVFLNHSEHPLDSKTLKETIKRCKKINLVTYVFANTLKDAKQYEKMKADVIIYEPKELVAGKTSVSEEKKDVIKKITGALKTPVFVGAGIKSKEDIDVAKQYGAKGMALSSAVTTAKNPVKVLKELI